MDLRPVQGAGKSELVNEPQESPESYLLSTSASLSVVYLKVTLMK